MDFRAPEGFGLIRNLPPAYDYGKFYIKLGNDGEFELGFFIRPEHTRSKDGYAGGGIFLTAADYLMGFVMFKKLEKVIENPFHPTTVSFSSDFIGSAKLGEWVTVKVDVLKIGRQLCTAQCVLTTKDKTVLRASASYLIVPKTTT